MFGIFKKRIQRKARVERKTKETQISCSLNIDGKGKSEIDTGIGFLDHMLELFIFHGKFDLVLKAQGDLKVDLHHTNEDVGIVLGQAFKKALGDMKCIERFGSFSVPMEDVLANVALDIGGRNHFKGIIANFGPGAIEVKENYTLSDANHFFEAFTKQSGINLIIKLEIDLSIVASKGVDTHTVLEPVFKALGMALERAASIDPRRSGVPSTKGIID